MSMNNYLFTSESVAEGHPDNIADHISDGILDAIIAEDPNQIVAPPEKPKRGWWRR